MSKTPSASPSGGLQGSTSAPDSGAQAGAGYFLAAGSGSTGPSGGGLVYMGGYAPPYGAPAGASAQARRQIGEQGRRESSAGTYLTLSDAENYWHTMGAKQQKDFLAHAIVGGLLKTGDGAMEGFSLWKKLVKYSQAATAQGVRISPMDVLSSYVGGTTGKLNPWQRSGDFEVNALTGERRYVGPKFKTTTQTNTDLTDPTTAKALATSVFQQLMGRDPGAGELAGFGSALQQAEQASPAITTTTTQYDSNGDPVGSNATTQGGLTSDAKQYMAAQEAKKKPEYGAVQAATTYENALESAVYGAPE